MEWKMIISSINQIIFNNIGWFGDAEKDGLRKNMVEIGNQHPHLFEFKYIKPRESKIGVMQDSRTPGYMTMPQLVAKYKYLIDIRGGGYSGRLKYFLFSHRPLFIVERECVEYFQNDLQPFVHYIPVSHNLSDLVERAIWVVDHPVEAHKIAVNAYNFAKNEFTMEKLCNRIQYVFNNTDEKYYDRRNKE